MLQRSEQAGALQGLRPRPECFLGRCGRPQALPPLPIVLQDTTKMNDNNHMRWYAPLTARHLTAHRLYAEHSGGTLMPSCLTDI